MFVVPTADPRMLFALVIVAIDRRLIVSINVTAHPTAEWIARQVTEAFPWDSAPKYLIRDRDGAYGHAFKRRLHAMGIRDRPTPPRSPWQNPYAERLISSIRRECVDHLIAFVETHLRRILKSYVTYYNDLRTHLSLAKDAPSRRPVQRHGLIILECEGIRLVGKNAVVVGASNIVGKPMALMLMQREATVSICHAKTRNLAQFTVAADVLVVAAGHPNLIVPQMVRTGAIVIDVGINRLTDGKLVGDVDFEGVRRKASAITPVPEASGR